MVLAQFAIPTQLLQLMCPHIFARFRFPLVLLYVRCNVNLFNSMFNNNSLSTGTYRYMEYVGIIPCTIYRTNPIAIVPSILSRIRVIFISGRGLSEYLVVSGDFGL